ncbi:YciI family protein [Georgenia wangjunii]|uniref:YciI family protein n=1 Tax=Georgenia wangjunii TaxID=3117730 RepID=UPI002F26CE9B
MTIFAVEYTYDSARTDDVATLRPEHREYLAGLVESGELLASGPWLDNAAPGALLLVVAQDVEHATRLLDDDPFHRAHLITHRTFRAWNPVLGVLAES